MNTKMTFNLSKSTDITKLFEELEVYKEDQLIPDSTYFDIKLCLEELIINIFKYGYTGISASPFVEIVIEKTKKALVVEVKDNAKAFNPLSVNYDLFNLDIKDRPLGGIGIHLVQKLTDTLEYVPLTEGNKIIFEKHTIAN